MGSLHEMSEADFEVLREQLERLHGECWGWALACCRGVEEMAEEVLHMSYHKVLDQRARYDGRAAFKTWFFSVIRLTALDHQRWSVRRWLRFVGLEQAAESMTAAPSAGELMDRRQRCAEVRLALRSLPARQEETLRLVFFHDLTLDEAARVMGVSPGSARQHYERGKTKLRTLLRLSPDDL